MMVHVGVLSFNVVAVILLLIVLFMALARR